MWDVSEVEENIVLWDVSEVETIGVGVLGCIDV